LSIQSSTVARTADTPVERPLGPPVQEMGNATPRSLRSLVVSGFAWSLATNIVIQAARVVFAIALARYLTPHEYGLASMALVFAALVSTFSDLSLGVGLVQRASITEEDRSTVFWTTTGVGLALTLVGLAASGPVAVFYAEPEVRGLFAALSLSFVVGSLGATHAALLQREMAFRSMNLRLGISTLLGGSAGVALAVLGFGAWALIVQHLCIVGISTVLLWNSMAWRPQLVYSTSSLREFGAFGGAVFGVRLGDYARLNADKLLIGRILGSNALGIYSVAFNILLGPVSRFVAATHGTLLPAFSRLQNDPRRLGAAWLAANRLIAAMFLPAITGLVLVAPDFVHVALSPRWSGVAPLVQILALGILVQALSALGGEVLKAQGRAGTLLRFSTWETGAVLVAIAAAVPFGTTGVALAYTLTHLPTRAYLVRLTCRTLNITLAELGRSFRGVLEATAITAVGSAAVLLTLSQSPSSVRLGATVLAGVVIYLPTCLWRAADTRADLQRLWRQRRP
jgi:O-antigen/teichoic acid export membrane protein